MAEQKDRVSISLDEDSRANLSVCMTAYALENNGATVTFTKVYNEALRRWASTVKLPAAPKKGRA